MKHIILVGDGMADYPIPELGGKTPLEAANIPNMNFITKNGIIGRARTIPPGYPAGSDVANLSIFGYSPLKYYTGRAPLEAISMGINISKDETAFRCNLVNIENNIMIDFTAGHISSQEAKELISWIQDKIGRDISKFYPGVSYRNLLMIKKTFQDLDCTPPHDITGKNIKSYLPKGKDAEIILELMNKSKNILNSCPVNQKRISSGKKPVTMIWLWGYGRDTVFPTLETLYGFKGGVITAVDLIKGIGKKAGLEIINVPGATGYLDTNYSGKAYAALKVLEKDNFIFLHVEAPDEAAHEGNLKAKIKAIEDFDEKVVGIILKEIRKFSNYRIMVLADHPTPISLKTHTADPVPFIIMGDNIKSENVPSYNEKYSSQSDYEIKGENLIKILASGDITSS